jgi:flavodoxin
MFLLLSLASAAVLGPGSKVLICWFSRSGVTKHVVDTLQPVLNADVYEIRTGASYAGLLGGARSMLHLVTGEEPQLTGALPDVSKYDAFIIATPIWAARPARPIISFLHAVDFGGKPVIPLSTCRSNAGGFLNAFKKNLGTHGKFVSAEPFYDVGSKSDAALAELVKQWAAGI